MKESILQRVGTNLLRKSNLLGQSQVRKQQSEQIINEEVRISDFAHTVFQDIREIDGIDHNQVMESFAPALNNKAVFKAGES